MPAARLPAPLDRAASALAPPRGASWLRAIVVATFCLMIASFLFEMPPVFRYQWPSLAATLFLATTMLQPKTCFGRMPHALLWFLGYLYVFVMSALLHGSVDVKEVARFLVFLIQAVLVFWAGFNLMSEQKTAEKALWWFVIACLVRAALPMVGVGRTTHEERWTGGERVSAFGQDPNFSAVLLSAGLLTLIWLTHGASRSTLRPRFLVWPLVALLGMAILGTGSRGGLAALSAGLLAFTLTRASSLVSRLRYIAGTLLAVGVLAWGAMHTEIMRGRVEVTMEEGNMAGREQMFPILVDMFLEKPVSGWGPMNNQYELAKRWPYGGRMVRAAHNLYLEVLTESGMVGALPFLVGVALCLRAAWRARGSRYGILPLALLAVFLTGGLTLDLVANKPLWLVLGFALASDPRVPGAGEPDTVRGHA